MKKLLPLLAVIIVFLSSCSTGFHNGRQYANRRYIKIGPGISVDNTTEEVKINTNSTTTRLLPVENKVPSVKKVDFKQNKPNKTISKTQPVKTGKANFFKTTIKKIADLFPKKSEQLQKHVEKQKGTKSTSVLNILGFIFGVISVVLAFVTVFMFLFTLAFPATAATCITMVIVVCSIAIVALALSITGVVLQSPKRGLGIAGIITAGVAVFLVLLAMGLFFAFL